MMADVIFEGLDKVSVSESFFLNYEIKNDCFVMSTINVNIFKHPLNNSPYGLNIDYSYIFCRDVAQVKINKEFSFETQSPKFGTYEFVDLECVNVDNKESYCFEILCKKSFLQVRDNFKLSENLWLPIDTPYYPANMLKDEVVNFFERNNLPENLKLLLK